MFERFAPAQQFAVSAVLFGKELPHARVAPGAFFGFDAAVNMVFSEQLHCQFCVLPVHGTIVQEFVTDTDNRSGAADKPIKRIMI